VRILLALLTGVTLLAACHAQPPPPPLVARGPVAGRLTVGASAIADIKTVAAAVVSRDMGEARARIGGTLVRLTVREGDQVRAGQVIGFVRDARLALETRSLDAQVIQAEALAAQSAADLSRVRTLYEQGIYAQARLDQALAAARSMAAGVSSARALRDAQAELASQGSILAPSSGRVTSAPVPEGSVVAAGQSVATVTAGATLVRLEMPEAQANRLHVGDRVRVDPASAVAAGVDGVIRQVYPSVQSGLVTADIDVPGLSGALVGQRISVQVTVGQRRAIVLPSTYVQTRYGLDYVRLIDRDGAMREAPVQTAPAVAEGQVEVLSGLAPGDVIAPAVP
jgi:RND family efflux transporter MFP subunit